MRPGFLLFICVVVSTLSRPIFGGPAEPKTAVVTGRVLNDCGESIPEVVVRIRTKQEKGGTAADLAETRTDTEGRYTIHLKVSGEGLPVTIDFSKPGYYLVRFNNHEMRPHRDLVLTAEKTTDVSYILTQISKPRLQPGLENVPVKERPQFATLTGIVINDKGEGLEDAIVRVGDIHDFNRHVDPHPGRQFLETRTGKNGRYELQISLELGRLVIVDAMKAGYRSAYGTEGSGGDYHFRILQAGRDEEASFCLKPGLHLKGLVVDQSGTPIPGARIAASERGENSDSGVRILRTGSHGEFEIFDYPLEPARSGSLADKGVLEVTHPEFLQTTMPDVYALSAKERANLRLVLPSGRTVAGRVVNASDEPVRKLKVEAVYQNYAERRSAITDDNGRFKLLVLAPGEPEILAHSIPLKQKIKTKITVPGPRELKLKLSPVVLNPDIKTFSLLGMTVTDLTPEVADHYDVELLRGGVVVLNPGKEAERLGLGQIGEGNCIHSVDEQPVLDTRGFVLALIQRNSKPEKPNGPCFIRFQDRRLESSSGYPFQLILEERDVDELKKILPHLKSNLRKFPKLGVVLNGSNPCVIRQIVVDSPAERAGLLKGDSILKFNCQSIETYNGLVERIRKCGLGSKVSVEIRRGDQTLVLEATL